MICHFEPDVDYYSSHSILALCLQRYCLRKKLAFVALIHSLYCDYITCKFICMDSAIRLHFCMIGIFELWHFCKTFRIYSKINKKTWMDDCESGHLIHLLCEFKITFFLLELNTSI